MKKSVPLLLFRENMGTIMNGSLFSRRTCGFLFLLILCTVFLFYASASFRNQLQADGVKPFICSHMEYDMHKGVNGSISSTAQLPLRELLQEKSSRTSATVKAPHACGCNAGTTEEYLYWHTPEGVSDCLFEQEKVLICKDCGTLQKRFPAEQLRHRSGDDSLPGICPGQ